MAFRRSLSEHIIFMQAKEMLKCFALVCLTVAVLLTLATVNPRKQQKVWCCLSLHVHYRPCHVIPESSENDLSQTLCLLLTRWCHMRIDGEVDVTDHCVHCHTNTGYIIYMCQQLLYQPYGIHLSLVLSFHELRQTVVVRLSLLLYQPYGIHPLKMSTLKI